MGRITANLSVTLDGVMQAPGRPDEDTRGEFPFGGWALPYADPEAGQATGDHRANERAHPADREDHTEDAGVEAHLLVDVKEKHRTHESEGEILGQTGDNHPAQNRLPPDRAQALHDVAGDRWPRFS